MVNLSRLIERRWPNYIWKINETNRKLSQIDAKSSMISLKSHLLLFRYEVLYVIERKLEGNNEFNNSESNNTQI